MELLNVAEGADEEITFQGPAILLIANAMCEMENGVQYSPFESQTAMNAMIAGKKMANE